MCGVTFTRNFIPAQWCHITVAILFLVLCSNIIQHYFQNHGELTILLSSLLLMKKLNKHLASDPIRTETKISKLSVINFSVVRSHLLHSSVQVTTWWWAKSSRSLICAEGICIGFSDIVHTLGYCSVNSFVVCTTLGFHPIFT